jgi:hypothetical protein
MTSTQREIQDLLKELVSFEKKIKMLPKEERWEFSNWVRTKRGQLNRMKRAKQC